MPKLNILIGAPGSGKTTYAKKCLMDNNTIHLSSDDIRVELYGFEDQTHNDVVFQTMNKRCKEALKNGKNVIYDATNINKKRRKALILEMTPIGIEINAYMFCTPIHNILETNLIRGERHLEFEKLVSFITNIDVPMYYEGFKNIYLINYGCENDIYGDEWFYHKAFSYDQKNPNHNQTLYGHVETVVKEVEKASMSFKKSPDKRIIVLAAKYHDRGKLYTQMLREDKGYCVYYNHEKVSAYLWFCHLVQHNMIDEYGRYRLGDGNYQVAALIAHHMDFYKSNLTKTEELFNDRDLFMMLNVLHDADKVRPRMIRLI